jgi:hypothetical protein
MGYDAKLMLVRKPNDMGLFGVNEHKIVFDTQLDQTKYNRIPFYGYEDEYFDNLKDYSIVRQVYYGLPMDNLITTYLYEYKELKFFEDTEAYEIVDVLNTVYKDFKSGVYCNIPIEIAKKVFGSLIPDTFNENTDAVFFYSD